jgi:hypothetical protein
MENGMESCVRCGNLAVCEKTFWKKWPAFYDRVRKMQDQYLSEPGACLVNRSCAKSPKKIERKESK